MTKKQIEQFNQMRMALKTIASGFQTPEQLQRTADREIGVDYHEALEYAYDNIQQMAKRAVKGVRAIEVVYTSKP